MMPLELPCKTGNADGASQWRGMPDNILFIGMFVSNYKVSKSFAGYYVFHLELSPFIFDDEINTDLFM
jgi:hypothetical protein